MYETRWLTSIIAKALRINTRGLPQQCFVCQCVLEFALRSCQVATSAMTDRLSLSQRLTTVALVART